MDLSKMSFLNLITFCIKIKNAIYFEQIFQQANIIYLSYFMLDYNV